MDNPYLAHRNGANGAGSTAVNGASGSGVKNPLNGLVPRRVSVEQAKSIQVGYVFVKA
jgi:hypothetical protein